MGCGASTQANSATKPEEKKDSFVEDLFAFILKVLKDEYKFDETNMMESAASDEKPNQVEELLKVLAALIRSAKAVSPPKKDLGEFMCGCLLMFVLHVSKAHKKPGVERKLSEMSADVIESCRIASAIYDIKPEEPKASVATALGVEEADVLFVKPESDIGFPAHAVVLHKASKQLLVVVRGTSSIKDVLTDAAGAPTAWENGFVHEAMGAAATRVFNTHRDLLIKTLKENPGFNLRTIGHSLGGGTAALIALMMKRDADFMSALGAGVKVTSVGAGSAAVMSRELSAECESFVTTVIHDSDIVPRLCGSNLQRFIDLGDNLVDVFNAIKEEITSLFTGKMPEDLGMALMAKWAKRAKQLVTNPRGLLEDMVNEKLAEAQIATDAEEAADPDHLYPAGTLLYAERPSAKGMEAYSFYEGEMSCGTCGIIIAKGSMFSDHSSDMYKAIIATGKPAPPAASPAPAA